MKRLIAAFLLGFSRFTGAIEPCETITSAAGLTQALQGDPAVWDQTRSHPFDITGTIALLSDGALILIDTTGATIALTHALTNAPPPVTAGDRIRVQGDVVFGDQIKILTASCHAMSFLQHGSPPQGTLVTGPEFTGGDHDYRPVRLRGRVLDAVEDETDNSAVFLILDCDDERIPCPQTSKSYAQLLPLIGRRVEAIGICTPAPLMGRLTIGRTLWATHPLCILDKEQPDLFDVPELVSTRFCQPRDVSKTGRRRMSGQVIAVLNSAAIVRTKENLIARIDFHSVSRPRCGDIIEASGLPETDAYVPILRRAIWRKTGESADDTIEEPVRIPFESIFLDKNGQRRISTEFHGKTVSTIAKVRSLPSEVGPVNYMLIGDGNRSFPVDISAVLPRPRRLGVGCLVEISGVFVLECQPWRPNAPIPPINSVRIIVRSADDIRILDTPSWWTAGRLLIVVGILLVGLVLFLVWNLALRRLAERRGQKLSDERIARAEAEIKTMERTRLAVELHDTIAQNLTGVSIALDTARQFCQTANPNLLRQIDVAGATLDSCQTELRNCLWDLRNQALDETDLNTAIRTALQPHVTDTALDIRFNVDRSRLTENTTHAILRIIRELVINAIRHGHATRIQIAGALDPDALRFSVRDNGCGFDVARSPGIAQKHFGLQGIRERLSLLNGDMTVDSARDSGTRVIVTIPLPSYQDEHD